MGVPRLVVAKVLNHVETGVTAVYDRHSYDREKREALEAWAARLLEILRPSTSKRTMSSVPVSQVMHFGSVNRFEACADPVVFWHCVQWQSWKWSKSSSISKETAPQRQLPEIFCITGLPFQSDLLRA